MTITAQSTSSKSYYNMRKSRLIYLVDGEIVSAIMHTRLYAISALATAAYITPSGVYEVNCAAKEPALAENATTREKVKRGSSIKCLSSANYQKSYSKI